MAISRKIAELFYEVRGKTEGFTRDLKGAEQSAAKLGDFIHKHPVAAAGALAAALVSVGATAVKMAEELERSFNLIERRVPGAVGQMDALKSAVREISLSGAGRTQDELARAAALISEKGVESIEGLQARLEAAARAADATGESIEGIIGGLDQTLDLFAKSSAESEQVLQRAYAVTRGRMPLEDVFAALQGAAPAVRALGLDFDTATAALGGLLEEGKTAKQAATELKALGAAGADGRAEIEKLADAFGRNADMAGEYERSIETARSSTAALWSTLKNNLSAVLIDLGERLLPLVRAELAGLVGILDRFNGSVAKIQADSLVATVATIGNNLPNATARVQDLDRAVATLVMRFSRGALSFDGLDLDTLRGLHAGVASSASRVDSKLYDNLRDSIQRVIDAEQDRQEATVSADAATTTGTRRSAEEIVAAQAARRKAIEEEMKGVKEVADFWAGVAAQQAAAERKHADDVAQFRDQLMSRQIGATRTMTDDIAREFDKLIAKAQQLKLPAEATELSQLKASALMAQAAMEQADERLQAIKREGLEAAAAYHELGEVLHDLHRTQKAASLTTEDRAKVEEKIRDVTEQQNAALGRVTQAQGDAAEAGADVLRQSQETAQTIMQAVDGALQLASAFGLVDAKAANILRSIGQVAAGIGPLSAALQSGSTGAVIGAALPVVGALASLGKALFDDGKARREEMRALQQALYRLTESIRDERRLARLSGSERDLAKAEIDYAAIIREILETFKAQDFVTATALATAAAAGDPDTIRRELERLIAGGNTDPQLKRLLDALNEAAGRYAETLEDIAKREARAREDLDEENAVRRLRLDGKTDEADALAHWGRLQDDIRAKQESGLYSEEQIAELRALAQEEQEKFLADQAKRIADDEAREQKRIADEAAARERTITGLEARIAVGGAANARERDDRARWAAQAAELAEVTDPVIRGLIEFAHGIEEATIATARMAEEMRGMEDLAVRQLRAAGDDAGAEALAFTHQQERELERARAEGKSEAYIEELLRTLALEAEKRQRDLDLAGAVPAEPARAATTQTVSGGRLSLAGEDRIVALLQVANIHTRDMRDYLRALTAPFVAVSAPALAAGTFGGRAAPSFRFTVHNYFGEGQSATEARRFGAVLSDQLFREIKRRLTLDERDQQRHDGDDGVVT